MPLDATIMPFSWDVVDSKGPPNPEEPEKGPQPIKVLIIQDPLMGIQLKFPFPEEQWKTVSDKFATRTNLEILDSLPADIPPPPGS